MPSVMILIDQLVKELGTPTTFSVSNAFAGMCAHLATDGLPSGLDDLPLWEPAPPPPSPSMDVYQTSDRALFMSNRPTGARIRVVRMPSAPLVRRNGRPVTVPAISLTYSFWRGDQQWVLEELRLANENESRIDLRDTLWAELDRTGDYELVRRSGSF